MSGSSGQSLSVRAFRGMAWAYGSYAVGRLLILVSTAILARLLSVEQFGVVSLALIVTTLLDTVKDLGLSQALIVVDESEVEERANTVFFWSVAIGAALSVLTAAVAPLAALFFHQHELVYLLPALGLNFLLNALGATHYALAQKRIDFRSRTVAEMADVLVRGSVGIALALLGFGAWSLVIGYVVGVVAMNVALWWKVRWRPRLRGRREGVRDLLGFGTTVSATDLVSAIAGNIDYLLIGRFLGTTSLGLYTLGYRIPELVIYNVSALAGHVLFPAFASLDREALASAYLKSLRYLLMLGLPLAAGIALLAHPLVLIAFGAKWLHSVPVMQVLTGFALAVTVGIPAGTAYKAAGRPDVVLKLAIPGLLALVASVLIFVHQGIVAVALCQTTLAVLFEVIGIALAARLLGVGLRAILTRIWPPVVSAAAMAAVVWPIERVLHAPVLAVIAGGAAGAVVYTAVLCVVARDAVTDLLHTALPQRARRAAPAA